MEIVRPVDALNAQIKLFKQCSYHTYVVGECKADRIKRLNAIIRPRIVFLEKFMECQGITYEAKEVRKAGCELLELLNRDGLILPQELVDSFIVACDRVEGYREFYGQV
jgi:hypothetical protein